MKIDKNTPGNFTRVIPNNVQSDDHPRDKFPVRAVYNCVASLDNCSAELVQTSDDNIVNNSSFYRSSIHQHGLISQLELLHSIVCEKHSLYKNYLHYGHNPQNHDDILERLKNLPGSDGLMPATRTIVSELTLTVEQLMSSLLPFAEREALQGASLDQLKKREEVVQRLISAVALLPDIIHLADGNAWNAEQKIFQENVINELVSTVLSRFNSVDAETALRSIISSPDSETAEKLRNLFALNLASVVKPQRKSQRLALAHIEKSVKKARDYLNNYNTQSHVECPLPTDMLSTMRQICNRLDGLMPILRSGYERRKPPAVSLGNSQEWIFPTGIRLSVPAKKISKMLRGGVKKTVDQLKAGHSKLNHEGPSLFKVREKKAFLELNREQRKDCINARRHVTPLITLAAELYQTASSLKEAVQTAKLNGMMSVSVPTTVEQAFKTELSLLLDETPEVMLRQAIDSARAMAWHLLDSTRQLADEGLQTETLSQLKNITNEYVPEFTRAALALLKATELAEANLASMDVTFQLNQVSKIGSDLSALLSDALEFVTGASLHTDWQWLSKSEAELRLNWQPISTLLSKGKRTYRPAQPTGKDTPWHNTLTLTLLPLLNQVEKLRMQCRQLEAVSKLTAKHVTTTTDLMDSLAIRFCPADLSCLQECADDLKHLFSGQSVLLYTNGPNQHEPLSVQTVLLNDVQAVKLAAEKLEDATSLMLWSPEDAAVAKLLARVRDHLDRVRKDIKDVVEAVTGFRLNNYSSEGMIAKDAGEWIAWLQAEWEQEELSTQTQSQLNDQLDAKVRQLSRTFAAKDDPGGERLHQRILIATRDARRGEMTWPVTAEELLQQTKTHKDYTLAWAEKRLTYAMLYNLMAYQSLVPMFSINLLKNTVPSLLRPINLLLTPLTSIVARKEMNKVKPGTQKNYSAINEYRSRIIFQTIFRATSLLTPQLLKTAAASAIACWGFVKESDYRRGFLSRAVSRLPADMFWASGFTAWRILSIPSVQSALANTLTSQQNVDTLREKSSPQANRLKRTRRDISDMPEAGTTTRSATPADIPRALLSVSVSIENDGLRLMFDSIIADEMRYAAAESDEEQQRLLMATITRLMNYLESVAHLHDRSDLLQGKQVIRQLFEYLVHMHYAVSLNEMVTELSQRIIPYLADHDRAASILSQLKAQTKDDAVRKKLDELLGRATKAMNETNTETRRRVNITCLLEALDLLGTVPDNEKVLTNLSLFISGLDDEVSRKIVIEYSNNKFLNTSSNQDEPRIHEDAPLNNDEIQQALESISDKVNNPDIKRLHLAAMKKADGKDIFITDQREIEKLIEQTKEFLRLLNEHKQEFVDHTITSGKALAHQLWLLINCTDIPDELSPEVVSLADEMLILTARIEDTSDILDTIYSEIENPSLKDKVGAIIYRLRQAEKIKHDVNLNNKRLQALIDVKNQLALAPEQQFHSKKLRLLLNALNIVGSDANISSTLSSPEVIPGSHHEVNNLTEDQIRGYANAHIKNGVQNEKIKKVLMASPHHDPKNLPLIPGYENCRDGIHSLWKMIDYLEGNKNTLSQEEWNEGKRVVKKLWFMAEKYPFPQDYEEAMSGLSESIIPILAESSFVSELLEHIYSTIQDGNLKSELKNLITESKKLNAGVSYEASKINNYNSLMRFRNELSKFPEHNEIVGKLDLYLRGLRDDLDRDKFNTLTDSEGQVSPASVQPLQRPSVTVTLTQDSRGPGYPEVEKQIAGEFVQRYYNTSSGDHSYEAKRAMFTYALSVSNIHSYQDLPINWQDEKVFNTLCIRLMNTLDDHIQKKGPGIMDEIAYFFYDGYMMPKTSIYLGRDDEGHGVYKSKDSFSHEDVIQAWKANFLRPAPPPEIVENQEGGSLLDVIMLFIPAGRLGGRGAFRGISRVAGRGLSSVTRKGATSFAHRTKPISFRKKFKIPSRPGKTTSRIKVNKTSSGTTSGKIVYSGRGTGRTPDAGRSQTTAPTGSANRIGKAEFKVHETNKQVNIKTHGAPGLTETTGMVNGKKLSNQIERHVKKYYKTVDLSAQEYRIYLQSCYGAKGGIFSQAQVLSNRLNARVSAYTGKYSEQGGRPVNGTGGSIVTFEPTASTVGKRISQAGNTALSVPVKSAVKVKQWITGGNSQG